MSDMLSRARERMRWGRLRAPRRTSMGFDFVGPGRIHARMSQCATSAFIVDQICAARLFIHVGAGYGYYCAAAQMAGVRSVAFEPDVAKSQILMQNMQLNGWHDNLVLLSAAAWDRAGLVRAAGKAGLCDLAADAGQALAARRQLIPAVRLDDVMAPGGFDRRTFVVINAAGTEHRVLGGALGMLGASEPATWLIKISAYLHQSSQHNQNYRATFATMFRHGYEAYAPDYTPIDDERIDAALARDDMDVPQGYILFVPT